MDCKPGILLQPASHSQAERPACNQAQHCCCTESAPTDVMVRENHSLLPSPSGDKHFQSCFPLGSHKSAELCSGHHPSPSTDPPGSSGMAPLRGVAEKPPQTSCPENLLPTSTVPVTSHTTTSSGLLQIFPLVTWNSREENKACPQTGGVPARQHPGKACFHRITAYPEVETSTWITLAQPLALHRTVGESHYTLSMPC